MSLSPLPMRTACEVELDVFSGRQNPRWTLSDDEVHILEARLAALRPAGRRRLSANLGYRGLVVTIRKEDGKTVVRVHKGKAEIVNGFGPRDRDDPDRALERWLLETGIDRVPADIRELIRREIR